MNILIVEDNAKLAKNLEVILTQQNYCVDLAANASEGLRKAKINAYNLIILDLGLPDMDGIKVCEELRGSGADLPILMLTARIDTSSKVEGLDKGADDYLTKPFKIDELLARIRVLLRRKSDQKSPEIEFAGNVRIDLNRKKVQKDGEKVELTPIEFRILEFLAYAKGEVRSHDEIYEAAWGNLADDMAFSKSLKVHIAGIRKKLGKDIIKTSKGFGYYADIV